MRLYFAYGSNMWAAQMASRCPESRNLGPAVLTGYRWIITTRGYANVLPAPASDVHGVLFSISPADETSLDHYEGVAKGNYHKTDLPLEHEGGTKTALVYIDSIDLEGPPKEEYIHRINAGLGDAGLPESYVQEQIRRFIPSGL